MLFILTLLPLWIHKRQCLGFKCILDSAWFVASTSCYLGSEDFCYLLHAGWIGGCLSWRFVFLSFLLPLTYLSISSQRTCSPLDLWPALYNASAANAFQSHFQRIFVDRLLHSVVLSISLFCFHCSVVLTWSNGCWYIFIGM